MSECGSQIAFAAPCGSGDEYRFPFFEVIARGQGSQQEVVQPPGPVEFEFFQAGFVAELCGVLQPFEAAVVFFELLGLQEEFESLGQGQALVFAAFPEGGPGFGHAVELEPCHLCFDLVHKIRGLKLKFLLSVIVLSPDIAVLGKGFFGFGMIFVSCVVGQLVFDKAVGIFPMDFLRQAGPEPE